MPESPGRPVAPPMGGASPQAMGAGAVLDPVTRRLAEAGLITRDHLTQVLMAPADGRPLWQRLTALPGVDRARALRIVADHFGVPAVQIGDTPDPGFVRDILGLYPEEAYPRFARLRLLPFLLGPGPDGQQRIIFATDDPRSADAREFLNAFGAPYALYYADAEAVEARLREAFALLGTKPQQAPPPAPTSGDGLPRGDGQATPPPAVEPSWTAAAAPPSASAPPPPPAASTLPPSASAELGNVAARTRDRIVLALLRRRLVTEAQVDEALRRQHERGLRDATWRILTEVQGVDRETVFAEAARTYAFPVAEVGDGRPGAEFVRSVMATFPEEKREQLLKLNVLPFSCDLEPVTGAVRLAFITHDPTRPEVHRLMQALKVERFELHYAPESAVASAILEAYPRRNEFLERMQEGGGMAMDLGTSFEQKKEGLIDEDALEAEIGRSTLINLFEATLVEAVRQGASDIHIYPNARRQIEIHFRVDGRLGRWHVEDKVHPEALLAVVKDNATNVDRFEREMAQDGFIQRNIDEALIRFRVSVLPIANANAEIRSESIVIRILDDRKVVTDLGKLGLNAVAMERFDHAIRQPHGMVILTGPTGSGKSTTLVASLAQVVSPEVNVLTVEDPVEYIIPGVRQIKLSHKLGLEGALRAILRHDPDVVMVGEMRDRDTAELAIKLANTGHLTFSTLHTNDAPSAVSRLFKMGIEPFLIAYAINLVVAQRLIRLLCPACKKHDKEAQDELLLYKLGFKDADIEATKFFVPARDRSCKTCNGTGYKGRKAINECLPFSKAVRHLIVESDGMVDEEKIRTKAIEEGMLTLQDSARLLVMSGETSVAEMLRVTASEG
ncbi:MAG TPA: ATPase, T2SS/T4P/T4SS family [Rhodothermales bacterium]|nr:ATPase, T2SS/T4P/T4SS family [Rhodothermales bacterium]